jgi:hypothetical protein
LFARTYTKVPDGSIDNPSITVKSPKDKAMENTRTLYRHAHRTLPSQDSYQHPPLFTERANGAGSYCVLCEKDLLAASDRDAHCQEKGHQLSVAALHGMQQSEIAMHCAMLQNRMDAEMMDRYSQIPVQLHCHPLKDLVWLPKVLTKKATAMVDEHALQVRMSLLELAVWKKMCLIHMPPPPAASTLDYYVLMDWCQNGWKVNKKEMRNANEIGIILRLVLPFMG